MPCRIIYFDSCIFIHKIKESMTTSLQEFLTSKDYTKIKLHLTKTNGFEGIETFKLKAEDSEIKAAGAGAIDMETKMSKKNKVKIGKWANNEVVLVLFNLTHVNTALINHNSQPVDGIIGADILKKGKGIIDYEKKYLYLKL